MISAEASFVPDSLTGKEVAHIVNNHLYFKPKYIGIWNHFRSRPFNPARDIPIIESIKDYAMVTLSDGPVYSLDRNFTFESKRLSPYVDVLSWHSASPPDAHPPDSAIDEISCFSGFSSAYIHDWDDISWQSEEDVAAYDSAGRSYDEASVVTHPLFERAIDIRKNPGRLETFPGMILLPAWKMWFGPWALRYMSKERLLSFRDAYFVQDRGTCVFVQLYEKLEDYADAESRRRQQAFRDYLNFDQLMAQRETIFARDLAPTLKD